MDLTNVFAGVLGSVAVVIPIVLFFRSNGKKTVEILQQVLESTRKTGQTISDDTPSERVGQAEIADLQRRMTELEAFCDRKLKSIYMRERRLQQKQDDDEDESPIATDEQIEQAMQEISSVGNQPTETLNPDPLDYVQSVINSRRR